MKLVMRNFSVFLVVCYISVFNMPSSAQVVTYSVSELQAITVDALALGLTPAQLILGNDLDNTHGVGTQPEDTSDRYEWIYSMTRRQAASAIDGNWIQSDNDEIWEFDIPTNRVVVGNCYDHDRFSSNLSVMYLEALEYTVWGGNDKDAVFNGAYNPGDWELATIFKVYQQGYNQSAVWDDYTAELYFTSGAAYKYVHVVANDSISIDGHRSGDNEIDFVARPQIVTNISEIPDVNLKTKLQELVGDQDLSTITTLDLSNSGISILAGIELFPQLINLNLNNNQLERLDYVYSLSELEILKADNNQITNLFALSELSKLTQVSLKNNRVIDANPLVTNTGISGTINLKDNPLNNVSVTTSIPALTQAGITVTYDIPQGEMVTFTDTRLETKIRSRIGIPDGNPLMQSHLEQLTELNLENSTVSSLTVLEICTNLQRLYARNNHITDVSALANLDRLTYLDLNSNQIEDISLLTGLTNLQELHLHDNKVTQLPDLSNLSQLQRLDLSHNRLADDNRLADISNLSDLTNLTWLSLNHNQIQDISGLVGLSNLQDLHLYDNRITQLPDFSSLTRLRQLDLGHNRQDDNRLTDISNLSNLTNLYWLGIHNNKVTNISALANLTQLEYLHIYDNQITDISVLKNLTKLRRLEAHSNQITAISELMPWTNMDDGLNLENNQITDISGLTQLSNLNWIRLDNNQIIDITPLKNLTRSSDIRLGDNQIDDISVFAEMDLSRVSGLDLRNNKISDLSPLANNQTFGQNGGWVEFYNNPLSNVSVATDLPTLKSRSMSVNHDGLPDSYLALADPKVETAIRQALEKPLPEQPSGLSHLLTTGENLTTLDLAYLGVTDLSGLETMTNLESVDISGHQIEPSALAQQTALLEAQGIQIIKQAEWLASITATSQNATVDPQTVSFGVSKEATDDIDNGLDVPSPPPMGVTLLNAHFAGSFINLGRDFRAETDGPITYTLKLRADQDGFELTWDLKTIPKRYNSVKLKQTSPTTGLVIDLLQESSATLASTSSNTLTFDLVVREAVGITLAPGWNMISVPGQPLNTDPQSLISQVSGIVPPLYRWEAGTFSYQQVEELKLGESYWVLTTNESETVLEIPYQSVDSYVQSLPAGWNMIGSLSQTADFSQATDTPDDSIFPQSLFSWDAAGSSYQLSTQIEPGQGYWVLTLVDCQLTVQAGTTTTAAPMVAQTPELIFPLMIRGNNFRQQLHLGLDTSSNQGFDSFDQLMPPISPSTTGNRVQLVRAGYGLTQDVQPLQEGGSWTLEWSLQQSAQLQLDLSQLPKSHQLIISQAEETSVLQTGEAIEIAMGQGQLQLVLQPRVSRPEATRLLQNYPNPFNPETWIPFELKQTAEVELSIYDLRGQLVRQIDLGHKEAGHYLEPSTAIYWDGKTELGETIASGTYFYRLQAGSYNQIRKMIILK